MNPVERVALYKMLSNLSDKLSSIADSSDDFETSDRLHELVSVIDDSTVALFERKGEKP